MQLNHLHPNWLLGYYNIFQIPWLLLNTSNQGVGNNPLKMLFRPSQTSIYNNMTPFGDFILHWSNSDNSCDLGFVGDASYVLLSIIVLGFCLHGFSFTLSLTWRKLMPALDSKPAYSCSEATVTPTYPPSSYNTYIIYNLPLILQYWWWAMNRFGPDLETKVCSYFSAGNTPMQGRLGRQCACCPPANLPHPHQQPRSENSLPWVSIRQCAVVLLLIHSYDPCHRPQLNNANNFRGAAPPPVDHPRMHEVSVSPSMQAGPGPATREIRKTISLSEECSKSHCKHAWRSVSDLKQCIWLRIFHWPFFFFFTDSLLTGNVFVTYSVDVAAEMIPFAKFLTDYGFEPAVSPAMCPVELYKGQNWIENDLN